ncbi:AsmA family protein [Pseudomonas aeruginosa]
MKTRLEVLVDPLGKPVPFGRIGRQGAGHGAMRRTPRTMCSAGRSRAPTRGQALAGSGKVGGMLALQDASKPFPLQAEVSAGSTRAAVVGTLTDPLNLGALDLRLKLSGTSMANLYPLTGITLPDTPAYSTDGHLLARLKEEGGALFRYENFKRQGRRQRPARQPDLRRSRQPRPKLSGS